MACINSCLPVCTDVKTTLSDNLGTQTYHKMEAGGHVCGPDYAIDVMLQVIVDWYLVVANFTLSCLFHPTTGSSFTFFDLETYVLISTLLGFICHINCETILKIRITISFFIMKLDMSI